MTGYNGTFDNKPKMCTATEYELAKATSTLNVVPLNSFEARNSIAMPSGKNILEN